MPIFDYKCNKCQKTFEWFTFGLVDRLRCTHCKKGICKRQITAPKVFILKGDGFYKPTKPKTED